MGVVILNYIMHNNLTMQDKINLMQKDAAYDVADAEAPEEETGSNSNQEALLIRKTKAPATPPKVPKVFLSNHCMFNCAYCGCRSSNEQCQRYCNSPREIAEIAVKEAVKSGHGVFLTSSIYKDANYTEELIIESTRIMREELQYKGYIHAKIMPGTDPLLIQQAGRYANRLSVNIEVANNKGYDLIAKQKNKDNILKPMYVISELIQQEKDNRFKKTLPFATSQTTQLMAGSVGEDDRTIMNLSEALYRKFRLSRVYYTAFHYEGKAKGYDVPIVKTPVWRVRRLYQADRLMQLYGFTADEITPQNDPLLVEDIDPKLQWALRHIELYPIEINTADYNTLLRIPGIGITYAKRILEARRYGNLNFDNLKRLRISLKKSCYFITCNGKRYEPYLTDDVSSLRNILSETR